jgi:hypothetical protein
MELSMVDKNTPTATTRKTGQRFFFDREDTENYKEEEDSKQKKNEP